MFASATRESIPNAAGVMQVRPITNTTTTIRLYAITDRQQLRVLQCTSASCICMFRMLRIWSGHFAAQRHMASKAMLHVHAKGRGYLPVSPSAWWLRPVKALIFIPYRGFRAPYGTTNHLLFHVYPGKGTGYGYCTPRRTPNSACINAVSLLLRV